jgi:hypothetical protein
MTGREKKTERKGQNRERLRTSGLTRSSPLTRPEAKSFRKCQKRKKENWDSAPDLKRPQRQKNKTRRQRNRKSTQTQE